MIYLLSFNISSLHASLTDYEYFKYVCVTMYFMRIWAEFFSGYTAHYK